MMLGQTVSFMEIAAVVVYVALTGYLGWLGWRHTRSAADYMVGGRKAHPFIMALSYGSTFISTSAIVGFGGFAGRFGMSLMWLVFLNIFVGIFLAFVLLGAPTRRIGHNLDAHTFPELLGRRFQSKGIQVLAGTIIFLFMPLYAAAVIIGGCKFMAGWFGSYETALLVFSALVAVYVFYGGLKAVMYTDALQGAIMIGGMIILLVTCYWTLGGVTPAHQKLTALAPLSGHHGWTAMPKFGWGDSKEYGLWWTIVSTIILGVGIGVLAQPQLIVRFMTVRSKRELNRAVGLGGVFILLIPGTAYVVGSLSNAYFAEHGQRLSGTIVEVRDAQKGLAVIEVARREGPGGVWTDVPRTDASNKPVPILKAPVVVEDASALGGAAALKAQGAQVIGRSIALVYAEGDLEKVIPAYIRSAMPSWFGVLFLLTLLAAAMSTLSGQFHAIGTSVGRDVFEQLAPGGQSTHARSLHIVRGGLLVGIVVAVAIAWYAYVSRTEGLIARGTAIFFGLCTSAFLPAFLGALFFRRMTKVGALASIIVGFVVTAFWLVFIKAKEAAEIVAVVPALKNFFPEEARSRNIYSLLWDKPNWPDVDPLLIAFPVSLLTAVLVSLVTRPPAKEHVDRCFAR
jgi:SSS family solute:Na+ symporter